MDVYVCEDDKHILELITIIITELGYSVRKFSDLRDLHLALEMRLPRALIIDYWIKNKNAAEMIIDLRNKNKKVPIILISAISNLRQVADSLPVNAAINKPFDIQLLQETVQELVS